MTTFSRDNFERMLQRRHPYRLPFDISFAEPVNDQLLAHLGIADPVVAFDLDFRSVAPRYRDDSAAWARAYEGLGIEVDAGTPVGSCGHAAAPLRRIETVSQLQELPWPDVGDESAFTHIGRHVARIRAEERVAVGLMESTLFEPACSLRGMAELLYDLEEGSAVGKWLLDFFTERSVQVVRRFCRGGVDVIRLGDGVGTPRGMLMSPEFWRAHIRPRLASVVQAIRESQTRKIALSYYSDGDIRAILPDLIEMGFDIVSPIAPECMPIDEVIGEYRAKLAFWGMIGTQSVMPLGTPDEIERRVRHLANWVRRGAAVIVAPTHPLEPDVPWDNVDALAKAVRAARF